MADEDSVVNQQPTSRDMIFGSGDPQATAIMEIRRQSFRLKRIEADATRRFRSGIPTPRPNRPTSLNVSELRYVDITGISRTTPTIGGRTMTKLAIRFARPADQRDWHGARIFVKGYNGNTDFTQMTVARTSPAILILEKTGEAVSIAISSQNIEGQGQELDKLKTMAVTL